MNVIEKQKLFWKYETFASLIFLGLQYSYVFIFKERFEHEELEQYIYLWSFDFFFVMPFIFFVMFPYRFRLIVVIGVIIYAFIKFFSELGFNSIYFNTFITLFLRYRFLLLDISTIEMRNIIVPKFKNMFIMFSIMLIAVLIEVILEYLGITHPEKNGDSNVMTIFGQLTLFAGYYFTLAYFEFQRIKKQEKTNSYLLKSVVNSIKKMIGR